MLCLQRAVDNGGQSSNISTCGGNVKTRETKLEPRTNKTPPLHLITLRMMVVNFGMVGLAKHRRTICSNSYRQQ